MEAGLIRMLMAAAVLMVAQSQPQDSEDAGMQPTGEMHNCIDYSAVTTSRAEDERTIVFELIGGRTYRNRLGGRCPGLHDASRNFGTLAYDLYGSQLCRGDRVRVLNYAS